MKANASQVRLWDRMGHDPGVRFIELHPATNVVPPAPRFTFGTFHDELARHYYRHSNMWAIGVYRLNGFEVAGSYLLFKGQEVFFSPETNVHPPHINEQLAAFGPEKEPRRRMLVTGTAALITGPGHGVYGHWLSDFLPKLYLLHASGYDIRRIRFLLSSDTPEFGRTWLALAGVPPEHIVSFDPAADLVSVEELLVPTIVHNGVRVSVLFREAARFLKSQVEAGLGESLRLTPSRNLFVSRARASQSRPLLNREKIEAIAAASRLEIVHPEGLSLADQIRLFASAKAVVGEYGSALHTSMFSEAGTAVCNLRGSLPHPGFIQSGLGHVLNQPTGYVFGETDQTSPDGRFSISETSFEACLGTIFLTVGFD